MHGGTEAVLIYRLARNDKPTPQIQRWNGNCTYEKSDSPVFMKEASNGQA
jgi:hypothetical protein